MSGGRGGKGEEGGKRKGRGREDGGKRKREGRGREEAGKRQGRGREEGGKRQEGGKREGRGCLQVNPRQIIALLRAYHPPSPSALSLRSPLTPYPSPRPHTPYPVPPTHIHTDLLLFVAGMEPLTVMAMAWDGILYGAGGFAYAAFSMLLAAAPALLIMLLGVRYGAAAHAVLSGGGVPPPPPGVPAADVFAGPAAPADATGASVDAAHWYAGVSVLGWVWLGLAVLMLMRWATIAVPYVMRVGVFRKLRKVA